MNTYTYIHNISRCFILFEINLHTLSAIYSGNFDVLYVLYIQKKI